MVSRMFVMVSRTQAQEYSCDDAYRLMDRFAEIVARGEDAAMLMPLVQKHLEMCPDCREEFDALLQALNAASVPQAALPPHQERHHGESKPSALGRGRWGNED